MRSEVAQRQGIGDRREMSLTYSLGELRPT